MSTQAYQNLNFLYWARAANHWSKRQLWNQASKIVRNTPEHGLKHPILATLIGKLPSVDMHRK